MKSLINYIQERLIINKDYKDGMQFNKGVVILITEYHRIRYNNIVLTFDELKNEIKECGNNKFVIKKNKLLKSFGTYDKDKQVELERINDTVLYSYENTTEYEKNIFVFHKDNEHIYKFLNICLEKKIKDNLFFSADEILNDLNIDSKYMKLSDNDNTKQTIQMMYDPIVIKKVMNRLITKETVA